MPYDTGPGPFETRTFEIADLSAASVYLTACPGDAFVVRGAPVADVIPYRRHRPHGDEPATLTPQAHRLLPVDIDATDDADGTDLETNAQTWRARLPDPFREAACLAQATSSAGTVPGSRLRLWFWCDRPVSDAEARAWLRPLRPEVDLAIYTPSQPIYCAAPVFEGLADPFAGRPRHVYLPGGPVQVPAVFPDAQPLAGLGAAAIVGAGAVIGTRNNTLTSLAGTMRKRGLAAPAIAAALREHNATFPEPLSTHEVDAIALSVSNYAPESIPEAPAPKSDKAAARTRKRVEKDLADDPSLLPAAAARLAKHVRAGELSEGQALATLARGLDGATIATKHTRDELAAVLSTAPVILPTAPHWALSCQLSEDGNPIPSPENLRVLLTHHPEVSLWWNARAQVDMWERCPWHASGPVLPTDDFALRAWVSRELGWHRCPAEPLAAIAEVSRLRPHDPWRAWLEGLTWDGTERLGDAAHVFLGTPPTPAYAHMFAWWLISAVARSLRPGCQVDHAIVLEGKQMIGKTSALRALAMDDQFFTRLVSGADLSSPRTIAKVHGPVIIEMAELAVLRRAEVEAIKAFLDERTDRVQWLYARKPVDVPRSCVFAATTNDTEYLRDATGNRRWWPLPCSRVDLDALGAAREQLWAEAVALYRAGAVWWPTREESEALGLGALQADRQEQEPIQDSIHEVLERTHAPGRNPLTGVEMRAEYLDARGRIVRAPLGVLLAAAGLSAQRDSKAAQRVLRILGWEPLRAKAGPGRVRVWSAPDHETRGVYAAAN